MEDIERKLFERKWIEEKVRKGKEKGELENKKVK